MPLCASHAPILVHRSAVGNSTTILAKPAGRYTRQPCPAPGFRTSTFGGSSGCLLSPSLSGQPLLRESARLRPSTSPRTRGRSIPSSSKTEEAHSSTASNNEHGKGPDIQPCDALIVGAGPAGLATALLLAQLGRGGGGRWERIVLLEKRPSIDDEDADKSYVYGIDWRGLAFADAAGVTSAIEGAGIPTDRNPILRISPAGTVRETTLPRQKGKRSTLWLPRRVFLTALAGGLAEAERDGRVRLINNVQVTDIRFNMAGGSDGGGDGGGGATAPAPPPIIVSARDAAAAAGSGPELRFAPRLLIGADGLHSEVRRALEERWGPAAGLPPNHYRPVVLDSPAAGLRYKVLQIPANPPFRRNVKDCTEDKLDPRPQPQPRGGRFQLLDLFGGGEGRLEPAPGGGRLANDRAVLLESVRGWDRRRALAVGLFPVVDPRAPRTATVVAARDHVLWSLGDGPQVGAFLQASFPQLDIPALFSPQQLEAAATSRGGVFPKPQYLRHFTAVLPADGTAVAPAAGPSATTTIGSSSGSGSGGAGVGPCCGVVLVGDAVHCFPPDLGQGVNSAVTDVRELAKVLDETGGDLGTALPLYESRRAPETAALVELTTFGAPYQYSQDKFRLTLWFANYMFRKALSDLAPWAFSPQLVGLMRLTMLSYKELRDRVHTTTRRIWMLAGALAAAAAAAAVRAGVAAAAAAATGVPAV